MGVAEPVDERHFANGKTERVFADGHKEVEARHSPFCRKGSMPFCREALLNHVCRKVVFANGVRKVSMPDGSTVIHFTNGDLKEATADGKCDSTRFIPSC